MAPSGTAARTAPTARAVDKRAIRRERKDRYVLEEVATYRSPSVVPLISYGLSGLSVGAGKIHGRALFRSRGRVPEPRNRGPGRGRLFAGEGDRRQQKRRSHRPPLLFAA